MQDIRQPAPDALGFEERESPDEGVVQRDDCDQVAILFEDVGYKTLSLSVEPVTERDLLEEAS